MSNHTKSLFFCWLIVVVVGIGGMWAMKQMGWIGQQEIEQGANAGQKIEEDMPPVSNPNSHRRAH
jgi:hypothetical protein